MFDTPVIAVTINSTDMTEEETMTVKQQYEAELKIPVIAPLYEGVDSFDSPYPADEIDLSLFFSITLSFPL